MRSIFAWGKAHGAWCITVRVSEPALAYYGAMHLAPCDKTLHDAQYERFQIHHAYNHNPISHSLNRRSFS